MKVMSINSMCNTLSKPNNQLSKVNSQQTVSYGTTTSPLYGHYRPLSFGALGAIEKPAAGAIAEVVDKGAMDFYRSIVDRIKARDVDGAKEILAQVSQLPQEIKEGVFLVSEEVKLLPGVRKDLFYSAMSERRNVPGLADAMLDVVETLSPSARKQFHMAEYQGRTGGSPQVAKALSMGLNDVAKRLFKDVSNIGQEDSEFFAKFLKKPTASGHEFTPHILEHYAENPIVKDVLEAIDSLAPKTREEIYGLTNNWHTLFNLTKTPEVYNELFSRQIRDCGRSVKIITNCIHSNRYIPDNVVKDTSFKKVTDAINASTAFSAEEKATFINAHSSDAIAQREYLARLNRKVA